MPCDSPQDWERFMRYCGQDVAAMRTLTKLFMSLGEWTPADHELWMLHQRINERGLPVDLQYVTQADRLMKECDRQTLQALKELTHVANPNSVSQLKTYCDEEEHYPIASLSKDTVKTLLSLPPELEEIPDNVRQLLELRQELSGAGPKKLVAIQNIVSSDCRLRDQHVFHGGRTGRFSGREVQTQNLPKPKPLYEDRIAEFTELIREGRLPSDVLPSDAVTGSIRSSFRAPSGRKLIIADFASIENRVLAWYSGCEGMLDVFRRNQDPYKAFGVRFFGKPYDQITKLERSQCKEPVLAGGFGLSWRALVPRAAKMGVILTDERAEELITTFRNEYHEVPRFWRGLEEAFKTAITLREVVEYQPSTPSTRLLLDATDRRILKVTLPGGRVISYRDACLQETTTPWGEMRPAIYYVEAKAGTLGKTYTFGDDTRIYTSTYGSKLVENVVQSSARDILCEAMLAADKAGLEIVGHCHDEIICESSDETVERDLETLRAIMSKSPAWAPGLPLGVMLSIEQYYCK